MAVLENGVLRWYIRFQAQNAEKAFSAKVLIDTIDQTYQNTERAPKLVREARENLMEEMNRTAFALTPAIDIEKFEMGLFSYTVDDRSFVEKLMNENLSKAHERAKSINAVRFMHLLEAKALVGGEAVENKGLDEESPKVAAEGSELEVDVIGQFEEMQQVGFRVDSGPDGSAVGSEVSDSS